MMKFTSFGKKPKFIVTKGYRICDWSTEILLKYFRVTNLDKLRGGSYPIPGSFLIKVDQTIQNQTKPKLYKRDKKGEQLPVTTVKVYWAVFVCAVYALGMVAELRGTTRITQIQ